MNTNKNIVIGVLIAALLIIGGYYFMQNKVPQTAVNQTATTTASGAPVVETSSSVGTSNSTALVSGKVKPNGASTVYWFDYGETTSFGKQTSVQGIGSGYSSLPTPAYITGLRANTLYYFRLSARNSFSTVNGATYSLQTNNNPPPQGITPTASTNPATDVARMTASVNGQVNPNGSPTTYWFEYGKSNNLGNVTSIQSAGSGSSLMAVFMSLSGLEPQTKYFFRFNAQNQYGTINGAILSFTTTGPAAASQPTVDTTAATNVATSGAMLNGRINPNGAETTYWFEYSSDSLLSILIGAGTPAKILVSGNNTVSVEANISGLNPNARYYYQLVGRNQYGIVKGDIVDFKTKP